MLKLAPCAIYMFPSMKKHLQGHRFASSVEVNVASQVALQKVGKMTSSCAFEVLRTLAEVYRRPRGRL
ncbi:hypothetical protein TNCV_4502931 [Trichonephila clavipes]|nr:hypothetical protein TNCV_4502931 [Trichonephila clavipes]